MKSVGHGFRRVVWIIISIGVEVALGLFADESKLLVDSRIDQSCVSSAAFKMLASSNDRSSLVPVECSNWWSFSVTTYRAVLVGSGKTDDRLDFNNMDSLITPERGKHYAVLTSNDFLRTWTMTFGRNRDGMCLNRWCVPHWMNDPHKGTRQNKRNRTVFHSSTCFAAEAAMIETNRMGNLSLISIILERRQHQTSETRCFHSISSFICKKSILWLDEMKKESQLMFHPAEKTL